MKDDPFLEIAYSVTKLPYSQVSKRESQKSLNFFKETVIALNSNIPVDDEECRSFIK